MLRKAPRRPTTIRRPLRFGGASSHYPFTITGFNPSAVLVGSPDTRVDVLGGAFPIGSLIYVNGLVRATNYVSASLVWFTVTAAEAATQKLLSVQVKTVTQASNAVFLPVAIATPTIATRAPTFGFRGEGNVAVAITGTGIYPSTTATANGAPIAFAFGTTTTGTITVPSATAIGDYTLALVNAPPGGGPSNGVLFQMRLRAPIALSISSSSLVIGRTNAPVTITGQASPTTFYADSTVEVDGVTVPSTTVTGSSIQFTFPDAIASVPGVKSVRVRNPAAGAGGGLSGAFSFEFIPFPNFVTIDISEVVQYFDGFPIRATFDRIDSGFVVTYNDVAQPTVFVDAQTMTVNVTSAACAVPGTTMVRARDTLSGLSTNAIPFVVSPWDPLKIGPSLRWWLDGGSLVDDGTGRAQQWSDKSGGARHITQPTAGKRPLIVGSAINGQPAARFDNVRQDNFNTGQVWITLASAGLITKTAYNIWVVVRNTLNGTNQTVLGESNAYIWICGTLISPGRLQTLDSAEFVATPTAPSSWSDQNPFALRARKDAVNVYIRVARDAEVGVAHGTTYTSFAPVNVFVGSRGAATGFWKGDIAEIIVANADLNYTYKAVIDNRLSYLYGLPFATAGMAPTISSVSPNVVSQLSLPFILDVYDTANSFTALSIVNVFEVPLATTYLTAGHLQARIPQAALLTAGGRAITVADAGGISGPKGISVIPYAPVPGPNLYSMTPGTGLRYDNDITGVVGAGAGFTPAAVAYAGAIPCATVVDNPNQITFTIPKAALYVMPGPVITVHDGAAVSNGLEFSLTDWSPGSIVGTTSWLRADSVTMGAGSSVAQLNDKTGLAHHLTQATATRQPLLIASDPNFNGAPSLDFDGVDDYMAGSSLATLFGAAHITSAVVYRAHVINGTGTGGITAQNNAITGAPTGVFGQVLHIGPQMYTFVNDTVSYKVSVNTNVAVDVTAQAVAIYAGSPGNVTSYVNRVQGSTVAYGQLTNGAGAFSIGSNTNYTANFLTGQIAEVVTSNIPWTAQDHICWPNYCTHRYGTP